MDKYYIGLDVGTNSVGWAVTNESYDLKRLRGKHAWGSRIFAEAHDCKNRRVFRASRRRLARRKHRIKLLDSIFAEEINKIDNTFFLRLDNASYLLEDKKDNIKTVNLVFKNKKKEQEYYKNYPTIYHLRKALMENDEKAGDDIRNIYMAFHHIMKYRGNFLIEGEFSTNKLDNSLLSELNDYFVKKDNEDSQSIEEYISINILDDIIKILLSDENKKTKRKYLLELVNAGEYKNYFDFFFTILTGGKYSYKKIDELVDIEIDFTKASFDEEIETIAQSLGDDFIIVKTAKTIYDYVSIKRLLGEEQYLSNAMVKIYENHKKDLRNLKDIVIDIDKNKNIQEEENRLFYKLFKNKEVENYSSFVHVNSFKDRQDISKLNKDIKEELILNQEFVSQDNLGTFNEIIKKLENNELLKIIANESTSVIPHQLHLLELKKIIDIYGEKYSFIKENKDKLEKLFKFRVPYYVGPLHNGSANSSFVGKSKTPITPWNFDEIIDEEATRSKFMKKLTNSCTYLYDEKVMPKVSLVFEECLVLDRLNVMLVNGNPLSLEDKMKVLEYLLSRPKTTILQLRKYLSTIYGVKENDILISNIKQDQPFEAKSHAHLKKTFDLEKRREDLEYFIFLATVYADDKKSLKELLSNKYKNLSEQELKCILTLPTKKWATISYALLNDVRYINDNGIALSILDLLKETNKNFQMILNDKEYDFISLIRERNGISNKDPNKQVEDILSSVPSITRRSIHQTLLIIDDIIKASKSEPQKIFVEVTRKDDEKLEGKESSARASQIEMFLDKLLKENIEDVDVKKLKEELNTNRERVKGKHLYLYFKQMGIDMYTGKKINIEDVINSTKYDIDHIIPQSLIKDDSLDNMVLVDREYNQRVKRDIYPIPLSIRTPEMIKWWTKLRKIDAISERKLHNLTRSSEISLEEIENFVARQINVVNYSNIALRNILEIKYPNTKIVFSKSQYPSYIRKELNIAKNRDINDTHHAVDAYLNVVAGNILSTEFSNVYAIYHKMINHEKAKRFNMEDRIKDYLKKDDGALSKKIFRNAMRRDHLVTFKVDYSGGEGALYKATLYRHDGKEKNLIPIHSSENNPMHDTTKYGGYSSLSQSYILAVEYEKKGKMCKALLRVPTLYVKQCKDENELLEKVVKDPLVKNIRVIRKINLNQKIRYKGCEYLLYTKNADCNKYKMAHQVYLSNDALKYINVYDKKNKIFNDSFDDVEIVLNAKNDKFTFSRDMNKKILDELMQKFNMPIYDGCLYIPKMRNIDKEVFNTLTIKEQIEFIKNCIKVLYKLNENAVFDKRFVGAPNKTAFLPTTNITDNNITLIYESPTGLYSKEVDI